MYYQGGNIMIGRVNVGGGSGVKGMPQFTYTGTYNLIDDGNDNWRIKFLTSGTLTFTKLGTGKGSIDVFCVGGGGGGIRFQSAGAGIRTSGGGGGYTTTSSTTVDVNIGYPIVVGAGGAGMTANDSPDHATSGSPSSFNSSIVANGGVYGWASKGGSGGSGGAGCSYATQYGGSNGGNGNGDAAGYGQGTSTKEFGESTGFQYSNGGNSRIDPSRYTDNTGDGGYTTNSNGYAGKSGIVVIRNHRS